MKEKDVCLKCADLKVSSLFLDGWMDGWMDGCM
jgi:hypothetical protein